MLKLIITSVLVLLVWAPQVVASNFAIIPSGLSNCKINVVKGLGDDPSILAEGSFTVSCPKPLEYEIGTDMSISAASTGKIKSHYDLFVSKEKIECKKTPPLSFKMDSSKESGASLRGIGNERWYYCAKGTAPFGYISNKDSVNLTLENTVLKYTTPDDVYDIFFPNDSYELEKTDAAGLDILFNAIEQAKVAVIVINGHASSLGSFKYNVSLSEKRVDSVKSEIISMLGTSKRRIYTASWGAMRHAAIKTIDANEDALNRRVTVSLYYKRDCSPEWLGVVMGDQWESKRLLCSERVH